MYATGLQESYFHFALSAGRSSWPAFCSRAAWRSSPRRCAVCSSGRDGRAGVYADKIPRTYVGIATAEGLRIWFLSNLFAFLAVAYLASLLAQSLRRKGAELEEKREELLDLQDFNEDIIHSMRGGLLTTDLDGRILLLNRTGEEILGYRFADASRANGAGDHPDFWLPGPDGRRRSVSRRKEIDFRTPDGQQRYLGISVSPLRTSERSRSGYVFNFQDLTELRRLEQEVATKERMAALGRLSAAIAHEIRQPLTAMAGAVKELARLVPLEEDEKHLVDIVSRESERLNHIITDFLNYSREKTYEFAGCRRALAAGRNADADREEAGSWKASIASSAPSTGSAARARGRQQDQAGVLESLRQRPARHARTAAR